MSRDHGFALNPRGIKIHGDALKVPSLFKLNVIFTVSVDGLGRTSKRVLICFLTCCTISRARDSCSCDQSNLLVFRILSFIRWVKNRILLDNKKADEN